MQMYQIRVGTKIIKGEYTESEASKVVSSLKNCVKNPIELIPVKQEVSV